MIDVNKVDFEKMNGLVPAIIVDAKSKNILMLGFMNKESLEKTIKTNLVTFFSRSRNELWTKGETSGNYLHLTEMKLDCDNDSILIFVNPDGNVCHSGEYSCFGDNHEIDFLNYLFDFILKRKNEMPVGSYTTKLFERGENRIIQKVGEESVEVVIAAKNNDKEEIVNEVSDLFYHLFVMLAQKNIPLSAIVENLKTRHKSD